MVSVIMVSVIMLSVIMLSVIMLNVIMLSVMAPFTYLFFCCRVSNELSSKFQVFSSKNC